MSDDDENYPPEGGCLGFGSAHTISERGVKKPNKNPIGFVHFPDRPEKPKRPAAKKARRRKK